MVKLWCARVGNAGDLFSVEVDGNKSVSHLKAAIKDQKKDTLKKIDAKDLRLYLVQKNGEWLDGAGAAAVALGEHGRLQGFECMDHTLFLQHPKHFGETFQPGEGQVHVLVVVPEKPVGEARAAPVSITIEQLEMIINKVLNERDERLSVYTISTCTRSKEERLKRKLSYHYKTIDAMEEVDDSIDSYAWQENLAEDIEGGACSTLKPTFRVSCIKTEAQELPRHPTPSIISRTHGR
nr:Crinkler effector protein 4 [Phytophthora ramorum]